MSREKKVRISCSDPDTHRHAFYPPNRACSRTPTWSIVSNNDVGRLNQKPQVGDFEPTGDNANYTIPNKAYINDLVSLWGPDILLVTAFRQWERVEVRDLRHEGFKIVHVDDTLKAQFLAQMSDPDVHGIVVLAHGDPNRQGDFSDAGPDYVTSEEAAAALHHKLGGFKAIWCFSGVDKSGWRGLVSPTGYLWSYPGYIRIWQSWPFVIRHGFKDE